MSVEKNKATYEDKVPKSLEDPGHQDKSKARTTIEDSFSDLLDELGEPVAPEDADAILKEMMTRAYYA